MARPTFQAVVKAFGFGVYMAELNPSPEPKVRPNGKKDLQQTEIFRSLRNSGLSISEVILDFEDESRAYVMSPEGHQPTKYELALIEPGDWERIRTSVDMWGTEAFSQRVTLLETHRTETPATANP